jgi:hypothetical protein
MSFQPCRLRVCEDLLFLVKPQIPGDHCTVTCRCVHIPSLVVLARPGQSVDLTEEAFSRLPQGCRIEMDTMESIQETIYPFPSDTPLHPRYCFTYARVVRELRSTEVSWEDLEIEIDLSIPGPIKPFRRITQGSTVSRPGHAADDNLLLFSPLSYGIPRGPLRVRFSRVGWQDAWRVANVKGYDKMRMRGLFIDRDAGYIYGHVQDDSLRQTRDCPIVWWFDPPHRASMMKRWLFGWRQKLSKTLKQ